MRNWYWYINQDKMYFDFTTFDVIQIADMGAAEVEEARNWLMFMSAQIVTLYNEAEQSLLRDQLFRVEYPYIDDVPIKCVVGSHGDPEWRTKSPNSWMLQSKLYCALTAAPTRTSS